MISLSGGYILLKALNQYDTRILMLLSIFSLLPDLDHFIGQKIPILHNLSIILLLLAASIILYKKKQITHANYLITLTVMLTGHLLMDMVGGLYGIPLLYPLNSELILMPAGWDKTLPWDDTSNIISRLGIAMLLYYGLVFSVSSLLAERR